MRYRIICAPCEARLASASLRRGAYEKQEASRDDTALSERRTAASVACLFRFNNSDIERNETLVCWEK